MKSKIKTKNAEMQHVEVTPLEAISKWLANPNRQKDFSLASRVWMMMDQNWDVQSEAFRMKDVVGKLIVYATQHSVAAEINEPNLAEDLLRLKEFFFYVMTCEQLKAELLIGVIESELSDIDENAGWCDRTIVKYQHASMLADYEKALETIPNH